MAGTVRTIHEGRTTPPAKHLSKSTLEFCDQLIDGVTLSIQAPNFEQIAKQMARYCFEHHIAIPDVGGLQAFLQQRPEILSAVLTPYARDLLNRYMLRAQE